MRPWLARTRISSVRELRSVHSHLVQVQPVVEGQSARRESICFDHELALGRHACGTRCNMEVTSVCNWPATTEGVPDHAEKEAKGS